MENNIIDSNNVQVEHGESRRLSYEMLFNDVENGNNSNGLYEKVPFKEHRETLEKAEDEWKLKLEEARSEGYQKGFEEGIKEGEERILSDIDRKKEWMKKVVSAIEIQVAELMDDLKPQVATLVFDITEKILGLPVKSEKLRKQVKVEIQKLISSFDRNIQVTLVVAPSEYEFVSQALKELPNPERIQLTKSEKLSAGEYTVDTSNERIVKNFSKMLLDFREEVALEEFELETEE